MIQWKRFLPVGCLVLVLGAVFAVILSGLQPRVDSNVTKSDGITMSQQDWEKLIQEQTDASYLTIMVNTNVTVEEDGTADLLLENSLENDCNLRAVVTLEDGTLLYESDILSPGQKDYFVTFQKSLEAGSYPALVTMEGLAYETNEIVGQAEVETMIHVKEVVVG